MNPSRGELLKPGQQGNGTAKLTAKTLRSVKPKSRFEVLTETVREWWNDRLKVGEALKEIKDSKLFEAKYQSFDDFCEEEFGLKRTQAYGLIQAVNIKTAILLENPSGIPDKISNENQVRALSAVPAQEREKVVEAVVEKGSVTAAAITAVAKEIKEAKAEPVVHLDKTNYPIPEEIYPDWERAEAFAEQLRTISQIKSLIAKGLETGDVIFRELNNDTVSTLKNVYGEMKCVIPYAVCSSCQGRSPKRCALCKGRGFLSRFAWDQFVPSKTKEMRERMSA